MLLLVWLLAIVSLVVYVMTPEERLRSARRALAAGLRLRDVLLEDPPGCQPFRDALRARTRWPLVTLTLLVVNVAVVVLMFVEPGSFGDPATLLGWGASAGPRTTTGEWWRLVTAAFVQDGIVALLVYLIALFQLGLILERLVGHVAFAGAYLAAAVLANFKSLATHPVAVTSGASGAIFGLYGLFIACVTLTLLYRSPAATPPVAFKKLGPVAAVFVGFSLADSSLDARSEAMGLLTGLAWGVLLARGIARATPPSRRVAAVGVATVGVAAALVGPMRAIVDVRPAIDRILEAEHRTANDYQGAVERFRDGRLSSQALAQMIDRQIVPDVEAARRSLAGAVAGRVPPEHQPLVAAAEEYFRLRDESWRLRARALKNADMRLLTRAEVTERRSLAALERAKPADSH